MIIQADTHQSTGTPTSNGSGSLAGHTFLVAGGSGNVGQHIVSAFLEGGARVIVPTRSPEKRDQIQSVHGSGPEGPIVIVGDMADPADGARILDEALGEGGTLDGAVASLGNFVPTRSILSASTADLSRAVDGYLMAHHGTARTLIPRLRPSSGSYTMIQGPLAFDLWSPEASLVSVATAAQAMLARAIMQEERAADPGARVNELVLHSAVGWEDTDKPSRLAPTDIGRYVARLAGPTSGRIDGQTIHLKSPDQVRELEARGEGPTMTERTTSHRRARSSRATLRTGGALMVLLGLAMADPLGALESPPENDRVVRSLRAVPVEAPPVLDGRLDDPVWASAPVASDFVQSMPRAGAPAAQRTEVRVLYDDRNLYVGMRMFDGEPDRIAAQLARRGAGGPHSDWAHVLIDSYGDGRTAFRFAVNPVGVKLDALHFDDTDVDISWEAVWEVATSTDSMGWTAEFRIPFSQLRFGSVQNEAEWGINFMRDIAREAERSSWAPMPPDAGRFVSLFGRLGGLGDVGSPRRLEVVPYVLTRADRDPTPTDNPFRNGLTAGADIGLDLTYGLGSNLTLTGTLNPDFGQVEADPEVVNLSAFESFFPERRSFFLEGSDIFRFPINLGTSGNESLFYSRRIGRSPQGMPPPEAAHTDMPSATRILGAAKLSGRTDDGWSIGVFNALTRPERARWTDGDGSIDNGVVEPLANHGVVRIGRDLNDGASSIGGMLTTLNRDIPNEGLTFLPSQAYALGFDGRHRFNDGEWEARAWLVGTHMRGTAEALRNLQQAPGRYFQRPDAEHTRFDPDRTTLSGVAGDLMLHRLAGRWRGGAILHARSPGFDVNEMGFHQGSDLAFVALWTGFVSYDSGEHLRSWNVFANAYSGRSWGLEHFLSAANVSATFEMNSGWGGTVGVEAGLPALDLKATRGGAALHAPARGMAWADLYTDRRRAAYIGLGVNAMRRDEPGHFFADVRPSVTWRPAPRLELSVGPRWTRNVDPAQYVGRAAANGAEHHLFGRIDQTTVSLNTRLNLTFTPDLTLEIFAQPFVSAGTFADFRRVDSPRATSFDERFHTFSPGTELREMDGSTAGRTWGYFPGGEVEPAYTFTDPGFQVRSLRGNAVLRWEYRPGSTLFLVWQQDRSQVSPGGSSLRLGRDLEEVFTDPAEHVFVLKITYWFGR